MAGVELPKYFSNRIVTHEQALEATVTNGTSLVTGFATSEPIAVYERLWDHIQKHDLRDITIRQALFMAPHRLLVGDALAAGGLLRGIVEGTKTPSLIGALARRANEITKKVEGLSKLIDHFRELQERRIVFVSGFMGAASNMIIPKNAMTRLLYPEFVGRNKSRMGIVDMQSVHFPDATGGMAFRHDGTPTFNLIAAAVTPPNAQGEMSLGIANGATWETMTFALEKPSINIVLYMNAKYPFTYGYGDASNTFHYSQFRRAANEGRLFVVEDETRLPSLPAGSFDNPAAVEMKIAENVVNHIEMHPEDTHGRAIQVGFGGTGVLAIKLLANSAWTGRSYTEMMEPFTWDLWEAGKIAGSHFVERDGSRTQLDGKLVFTFSIGVDGDGFYEKMHNNRDVICAPSSRVVIPEAFYGGLGINNCLSIDFQGHLNSAGRDKNHYSGIGGAAMINRGLIVGGIAYLCMKSTHRTPEGKLRSSVFPFQPVGTPLSLIGPDFFGTRDGAKVFLATEHGVAQVNAQPQSDFIRSIISVADPDFRGWLKQRAWEEFRVSV
ncbi:MAG: acetyl-CoA hydrolase/transferase C-terminal domain-containing protein [Candidatus Lernaella stagnicola]|nr:acetyl-CoA hydrolase/transferase C-terminal domain-containing protein [Candidatus Lernaella stagnicola]